VINPGDSVNLTISVKNTLSTVNNVPYETNWALSSLGEGTNPPCPWVPGGSHTYFEEAAFNGYYTTGNISRAEPLDLINPDAIYLCPISSSNSPYLSFQPDEVMTSMYSYLQMGGYWTNVSTSTAVYHPLGLGTYTIAVGDEWGDLVLLHFQVTSSPIVTDLVVQNAVITLENCSEYTGVSTFTTFISSTQMSPTTTFTVTETTSYLIGITTVTNYSIKTTVSNGTTICS